MSFAGSVLACWLLIAAFAFVALSAIGRAAADRDEDAELGIVGAAELRMLLGHDGEDCLPLEARLASLGLPSVRHHKGPSHRTGPGPYHSGGAGSRGSYPA